MTQDPSGVADPYRLPEALVAAQRWDSARQALGESLAGNPDDPRLLGLLVRTLRAQRARTEALEVAQRLITLTPQDPYALRLGTLVCIDVGWVDQAVGLATRAVERDPGNAANHLALSRAWAASARPGSVQRQLESAREAVLIEPNSIDAQLQIGTALAADGDVDAARAAYLEALRMDAGNTAALNNLAVLEMQHGSPAEAARHLAASLAANPQGASARHNLDALAVRVARRTGRWMLLAPLPALVAAGLGFHTVARALAALALVTLPIAGLRWWRALTAGQRRALRGLPGRLRVRTWIWPVAAGLTGTWAVVRAGLMPGQVSTREVALYLMVTAYLLLLNALVSDPGRTRDRAASRFRKVETMFEGD